MKYQVTAGGRTYEIEVTPDGVRIDGAAVDSALEPYGPHAYVLSIGEDRRRILIEEGEGGRLLVTVNGSRCDVDLKDEHQLLLESFGGEAGQAGASRDVRAPMPGMVRAVRVVDGEEVAEGDSLLVLEAMKMENELVAEIPGRISELAVAEGDAVVKGQVLMAIVPVSE